VLAGVGNAPGVGGDDRRASYLSASSAVQR
jgi:hypothetical protein